MGTGTPSLSSNRHCNQHAIRCQSLTDKVKARGISAFQIFAFFPHSNEPNKQSYFRGAYGNTLRWSLRSTQWEIHWYVCVGRFLLLQWASARSLDRWRHGQPIGRRNDLFVKINGLFEKASRRSRVISKQVKSFGRLASRRANTQSSSPTSAR